MHRRVPQADVLQEAATIFVDLHDPRNAAECYARDGRLKVSPLQRATNLTLAAKFRKKTGD